MIIICLNFYSQYNFIIFWLKGDYFESQNLNLENITEYDKLHAHLSQAKDEPRFRELRIIINTTRGLEDSVLHDYLSQAKE